MSESITNLEHAVPTARFAACYSKVRQSVQAHDVAQWRMRRAKDIPPTLMFIWDEMVHRRATTEPFKIAPIVNSGFNGIYEFVERELKMPPVMDAYAAEYFNDIEPTSSFAEVSIAHCYPNDIHICDVEFSDQRHPLPSDHPDRAHRQYKGLHVFGEFLERLQIIARARGADRISGLVASPPVHHVLARHGFRVSESKMAQMAARRVGHGHAMILPVNRERS